MKLSEAIREGAKTSQQGFGRLSQKIGEQTFSCTLGAARDAVYLTLEQSDAHDLEKIFPELKNHVLSPATKEKMFLYHCIISLNDDHEWTRERIADFVEKEGY